MDMLIYYLKNIIRSISKNRVYFFTNVTGLTAGLLCFALIALWVSDEISYDKFNKNYDRIVRLTGIAKTESGVVESAVSSAPMAKALMDDYPEVENAVRMDLRGEIVTINDQQINEDRLLITDPSFFDVFSYNLIKGSKSAVLKDPFSIVLTESAAKKYFGNEDPIGKTLTINMYDSTGRGAIYTVTGLMPDAPKNAHFTFSMLASFKTVEVVDPTVLTVDGWGDASFYTYLLLKKGVDQKAFSEKISQFYGKYIGDRFESWKSIYFYKLQPLKDIYLRSQLRYEIGSVGSERNVYIFSTIGFFILLLAAINYINLATANSLKKAKEVGVKKLVGAVKRQLVFQYLLEPVITAMVALVLTLLIATILQPNFANFTGKDISLVSSPILLLFLAITTLTLGIVSGIYPAFIISEFKPIITLKGSFRSGTRGVLLRRALVVSQFVITVLMISGIIIIYSQISFMKSKDLGYNNDNLVFLKVNGNTEVVEGYAAFKNDLLLSPAIKYISVSNSLLGSMGSGDSETIDEEGKKVQINTARLRTDEDYLNVYGISLLAGRNFNGHAKSDSTRPVILNETAIKKLGWKSPEAAIGRPFNIGSQPGTVIGVSKDFNFNSLQSLISPLAIYPIGDRFSRINLRFTNADHSKIIKLVEGKWKKHFQSALFDFSYSEKYLADQYKAEQRFSEIFFIFSILSLFIACLGLYGLIAYATSQKVKEIGVRKVLGATSGSIVVYLSRDFLRLILVAFAIAVPVAWYLMNRWLEDFAYRIGISWWMFAVAGLIVILVALLTVSYKSLKAAIANPVKSLRTE